MAINIEPLHQRVLIGRYDMAVIVFASFLVTLPTLATKKGGGAARRRPPKRQTSKRPLSRKG